MKLFELNTPVVFMIFNRPDTTKKIFDEIKKAKPPKLFIIADGPRNNVVGEKEKCEETKNIVDKIDWDCLVYRNYSDINLGCGKRISSGLDWVFSQVEEAIILEDDCLPHPSFFRFCEELLNHYKYDQRVMFISGDNFQFNRRSSPYSYYFSSYNHIWGWATWKRTWDKYDYNIRNWPLIKEEKFLNYWLSNQKSVKYWTKIFQKVYKMEINTWDYQLLFACWTNSGLSILPGINLVSNLGFGLDASHTKDLYNNASKIPLTEMVFPLTHPPFLMRDLDADIYEEKTHFLNSIPYRIRGKIKKILKL